MQKKMLFLCTGNYYRSRFAEELFNHLARAAGVQWSADSRALAIERGIFNIGPISPDTARAIRQRRIDLREPIRLPRGLSEEDLQASDRVIALKEAEHRPLLTERFPAWADRVEYWHVHDLDLSSAHEAIAEIERLVVGLIDELRQGSGK
jgi:protein-tyrosine phosphatase